MPPSPQYRLRKHPEYQRVYRNARKQWARQIAFFAHLRAPGSEAAQRSETPGPRIGLTVPKALGKAVDRNRIKRRLRALVRAALPLLGDLPVDVVLHPKRTVLEADFGELEREIAGIFRQVPRLIQVSRQGPAPQQGQRSNGDPNQRPKRNQNQSSSQKPDQRQSQKSANPTHSALSPRPGNAHTGGETRITPRADGAR